MGKMKKIKYTHINSAIIKAALILLIVGLFLPAMTFAGPIIRSGDDVSVEADQILEGDFYGAGTKVSISGSAENDVYIAGGSVTVNAPVKEDLVIIGGTVQVHGEVGDDLRVFGGEVTIADKVGGDLVMLGGTLKVLSTAEIEGDVLFFGGDLDIAGNVKGSVAGNADYVRIDSGIGGDVDVAAVESLSFGDRAEIMGDVSYRSINELARSQSSVVVGDINQEKLNLDGGLGKYALLPTLVVLFAALSAFLLFKKQLQGLVNTTDSSYGVNGLIGLGAMIIVPVVGVLLLVSILGIIPGILVLAAYLTIILAAWTVSGIILGTFVLSLFNKSKDVTLSATILGVVLMSLLTMLPYVGPLIGVVVFLIVLGGMARIIYNKISPQE